MVVGDVQWAVLVVLVAVVVTIIMLVGHAHVHIHAHAQPYLYVSGRSPGNASGSANDNASECWR